MVIHVEFNSKLTYPETQINYAKQPMWYTLSNRLPTLRRPGTCGFSVRLGTNKARGPPENPAICNMSGGVCHMPIYSYHTNVILFKARMFICHFKAWIYNINCIIPNPVGEEETEDEESKNKEKKEEKYG